MEPGPAMPKPDSHCLPRGGREGGGLVASNGILASASLGPGSQVGSLRVSWASLQLASLGPGSQVPWDLATQV